MCERDCGEGVCLLGFSTLAELQLLLFIVFLLLYAFTLSTNAVIISTIVLDRALHTPMYFFLSVLSCSETCYTFVIVPKLLVHLLARKKSISFLGCAIQMFAFIFLGCSHSFLLAAMGYDRYVAICHPLRYTVLMGHRVWGGLVAAACVCGTGYHNLGVSPALSGVQPAPSLFL